MKVQVTVTGAFNYPRLEIGEKVLLVKEPTNNYDDEAIAVYTADTRERRGYAANTYKTRRKGTMSGSRILDRLKDETEGVIVNEDIVEVELV